VCLGWAAASALLAAVAWRLGGELQVVLSAFALALVPAAATLGLAYAPGWRAPWTAFVWTGFACAASAASGGFASPMAAAFLLAPAFAAPRRAEAAEATFFAGVGYLVAGLAGMTGPAAPPSGALPGMGAAMSILCAGALVAAARAPLRPTRRIVQAPPTRGDELADQMAAQRRRMAELAHELRTPLTHIIGFADVMRQRLFGPMVDKYGEYVELIHTSGENLLALSNRLLDLSRLEVGKYELQREEFDIAYIAEEVVRLSTESAHQRNIELTLEPIELPLKVNADVSAMRQILVNLVANAIKFTPTGGAVRVRAYAHEGRLRLEVQDNGPGIPPAERARLGSAFERGASGAAAEGYGLGLSLVRAFAELHDGALSFHEAPGGGALVRVEAPVFS
jgi:signal transduction histidine kinase